MIMIIIIIIQHYKVPINKIVPLTNKCINLDNNNNTTL